MLCSVYQHIIGQLKEIRAYRREGKTETGFSYPFTSQVKQLPGAALSCRWTRSGTIPLYKSGTQALLLYLRCQPVFSQILGDIPNSCFAEKEKEWNQSTTEHYLLFSKIGLVPEPGWSCLLSLLKIMSIYVMECIFIPMQMLFHPLTMDTFHSTFIGKGPVLGDICNKRHSASSCHL